MLHVYVDGIIINLDYDIFNHTPNITFQWKISKLIYADRIARNTLWWRYMVTWICVNISSGNALLHDCAKPSPESMLTCHHKRFQWHQNESIGNTHDVNEWNVFVNYIFKFTTACSMDQWLTASFFIFIFPIFPGRYELLGIFLLSRKTSYCHISRSFEAARLGIIMIPSLCNSTGYLSSVAAEVLVKF